MHFIEYSVSEYHLPANVQRKNKHDIIISIRIYVIGRMRVLAFLVVHTIRFINLTICQEAKKWMCNNLNLYINVYSIMGVRMRKLLDWFSRFHESVYSFN